MTHDTELNTLNTSEQPAQAELIQQINAQKSALSRINKQILCNQASFVLMVLTVSGGLATIFIFTIIPLTQHEDSPAGILLHYASTPCRYGTNNRTERWFSDQVCPIKMEDILGCLTRTAPNIFPLNFDLLRFLCGETPNATATLINGSTLELTQQSTTICNNDNLAKQLIEKVLLQPGSNIRDYELKGCDESMPGAIFVGIISCLTALLICVLIGFCAHTLNNKLKIQRNDILNKIGELETELQKLYPQPEKRGVIANLLSWVAEKTTSKRRAPGELENEQTGLLGSINRSCRSSTVSAV